MEVILHPHKNFLSCNEDKCEKIQNGNDVKNISLTDKEER